MLSISKIIPARLENVTDIESNIIIKVVQGQVKLITTLMTLPATLRCQTLQEYTSRWTFITSTSTNTIHVCLFVYFCFVYCFIDCIICSLFPPAAKLTIDCAILLCDLTFNPLKWSQQYYRVCNFIGVDLILNEVRLKIYLQIEG